MLNMLMEKTDNIIFYDGTCPLCLGFVRFLLRIDKKGVFKVAPLQGSTAKKLLTYDETAHLRTVVVISDNGKLTRSDAVLEAFSRIGFPWNLMRVFKFLPKFLRDPIYLAVSRIRYKIFGRYEHTMLPENTFKERILG